LLVLCPSTSVTTLPVRSARRCSVGPITSPGWCGHEEAEERLAFCEDRKRRSGREHLAFVFVRKVSGRKKTPTDAAVRGAVVRLLRCDQDALGIGRKLVALLFAPETFSGRWKTQHKVLFKQTSKKLPDIQRNITVAWEVKDAYRRLGSYQQAVAEVAENRSLSERQVARIYSNIINKS
jgi:hypothetical protein